MHTKQRQSSFYMRLFTSKEIYLVNVGGDDHDMTSRDESLLLISLN